MLISTKGRYALRSKGGGYKLKKPPEQYTAGHFKSPRVFPTVSLPGRQ